MTDTANLFYRIDAGRFLAAVVQVSETERGAWILQFALDLVASDAETAASDYAQSVIAEADAYRAVKAEAGRKGGLTRVSNAQALLKQHSSAAQAESNDTQANQSVHRIKTSLSSDDDYSPEFLQFWEAYPKKVKKGAAFRAFKKKKLGNGKMSTVMAGLEKWLASRQWADGYVHDPPKWLNDGCYDDDPEPAVTSAKTPGGVML